MSFLVGRVLGDPKRHFRAKHGDTLLGINLHPKKPHHSNVKFRVALDGVIIILEIKILDFIL